MSKQFAVRKLDSSLAPSASVCDVVMDFANQGWMWSMALAEVTLGASGYALLYCYLSS
jgi:hypothetical protein